MDAHKICFITCVNDERYLQECQWYLNRLIVPDTYLMEFLSVSDAASMAAGYNEAMQASDAKYKVYLHQDTFIRNRNFIADILKIFEDEEIGLIGMIGTEELSNDGVMWNGQRCGNFYGIEKSSGADVRRITALYQDVIAVDGYLMVTQYDLSWREDLFGGWDFYDVSQCGEFLKKGYRVIVPAQSDGAWAIHDCGPQKMWFYGENRKVFLENYAEVFHIDRSRKRVLQPYTKEIKLSDVSWALLQNGYEPIIFDCGIPSDSCKAQDADLFSQIIKRMNAQMVFTHDFSPFIAMACRENRIPYIAWTYDEPLQALFDDAVLYDSNYIFAFDKKQYQWLKGRGAGHAFYQPLATNVTRTGMMVIEKEDERRFCCDVSFVGQLYQDELYELFRKRTKKSTQEECEQIIEKIRDRWDGTDRLTGSISECALEDLTHIYAQTPWEEFHMDNACYYEAKLLAHRAAYLERTEMLERIAAEAELKFYTNNKNVNLKGVRTLPGLSYEQELPKAYYLSRINLNSTLHTITSGVPLRVFDIMGCGGFLLTNYQPELDDLFTEGMDLEVYHNLDEMMDKIRYYLRHDRERIRIAMNGYQKVRQYYSYEIQVGKMMKCVEKEMQERTT